MCSLIIQTIMPKFFYPCLAMFVVGVIVGNISQTNNETKIRDAVYHECVNSDRAVRDSKVAAMKLRCVHYAYR